MVWRGNSRTVSGRIEFSGLCCRRKAWGSEAGLDLALFFSSSLGKRRRRRRIEAVALYSSCKNNGPLCKQSWTN